jgi:hypothetical protein
MTDDEIRTLAIEAVDLARRINADVERLGSILCYECGFDATYGDPEKQRQRAVFNDCYFAFDDDTPDELSYEKDSDLWRWALMWANGGLAMGELPPLPTGDEVEQLLRDEGLA